MGSACMHRVQSPSSINMYKLCPRKYYYRYIERLPSKPGIHALRGTAVHSALEDFFTIEVENINEQNYQFELNTLLQDLLRQRWNEMRSEFESLGLGRDALYHFYMESKQMLQRWFISFMNRLHPLVQAHGLVEGFKRLVPDREVHLESKTYYVQGFLDAVYEDEEGVRILDYKTCKSNTISDEYRLQLSIYALLYQEAKQRPAKVGIHFLKHDEEVYLDVTDEMIEHARRECQAIQLNTSSRSMSDYPKNVGPHCRWGTGQCDFFDVCFGQITIEKAREQAGLDVETDKDAKGGR